MRIDRTERFYKIDQMLSARRIVPAQDFLDELDISLATFKRDLEYLRDRFNAPIIWDRDQAVTRKDYGETRVICYGMLEGRMIVVGYTPRGADRHVFSMRKANEREQKRIAPLLKV